MDFDARVPIPFSVFPSSYRNEGTTTEQKTDQNFTDSRYTSRYSATQPIRGNTETFRKETRVFEEQDRYPERRYHETDVKIDIEEARNRRPYHRDEEFRVVDEVRKTHHHRDGTVDVEVDTERRQFERPRHHRRDFDIEVDTERRQFERPHHHHRNFDTRVEIDEKIVNKDRISTQEAPRYKHHSLDMGYYDEDGHYHSLRHGLHRAADRVLHPFRDEVKEEIDINVNVAGPRSSSSESTRYTSDRSVGIPHTITIPSHHIHIGDLLILQGRPCQVIKITVSSQTGQYRYLGVGLFDKQMYEETSFASNPSPSVYVQNMLGPVFKQYRVLDVRRDGSVVAMTESGNIKQDLPVLEQGGLLRRLSDAFANGRGSVRVLVIKDAGREMAVDMKVLYGASL